MSKNLEEIKKIIFAGKCENCEGYDPNCNNTELCDFNHRILNKIKELEKIND